MNAEYLRQWLSREQIRSIRQGNNPFGIKMSQPQILNIIKGKSKNFTLRNHLVEVAQKNEEMSTKVSTATSKSI